MRPHASNRTRQIARESVPVTHDRVQCLLDHARQVLVSLHALDRDPWTLDVSDEALDRAAAL